ncbi:PE-PGRS family protein PE_PGRS16 [Mycobacterium attenuatum]|nr:PE-PGRS family protein PE_PGRS16 [Mycobacterium attenuatum]
MSFVTTRPAALTAAAGALQIAGSSMAAQNAAAAAPTTGVVPAAADEVSALQAAQFAAYGTWYQQVSAQAAAIHQMLVNTLGSSAGSYAETEAANRTAAGATTLPGVLGGLAGAGSSSSGPLGIFNALTGGSGLSSSSGATIGTPIGWAQNFSAAASDLVQVEPGQHSTGAGNVAASDSPDAGLPAGAPAPAGSPATEAKPVLAGSGQASSLGGLSVPPSWATASGRTASSAPGPGFGWTSAAAHDTAVTAVPAGMPAASAGRAGLGFGTPRYGTKPMVMPKPTVT